MDTDKPLKLLFQHCAEQLLALTGDVAVVVRRSGPMEINALARRADCVLELEKDGETYYRHLEFQDAPNAAMARRCFEYNTQLIVHLKAPVVTTVLYVHPPRPKRPLMFRVHAGGREVNRWRFDEICLWDMEASQALASVGLVPLVPLMRGGANLAVIQTALTRIAKAFPPDRVSIAQSSLYTEGRAEGRAEGRVEGEREVCAALVRKHHPALFERVRTIVNACDDPARLTEWALAASDLTDEEFLALLGA
jgi:predicted transposase YdaD